jgi:uncharacterized LabA/DUF88 family protein
MRVAVFIDWMNVYKSAREAFDLTEESGNRGQVDPYRIGRVLAAANGRGKEAELVRVEVHRGQPLPNKDPIGHAASVLHEQSWRANDPDGVVKPQLRPLRFNPHTHRLEEKGVDVALASCAVEWAVIEDADSVVIFSHDTDLSPVVEVISRIKGPEAVQTASWKSPSFHKRIPPIKGVNNLPLHERIFLALEVKTHYGKKARQRIEARAAVKSSV